MYLTGEGALLAVALTALVCGIVGAWALLRGGCADPRAGRHGARSARRGRCAA